MKNRRTHNDRTNKGVRGAVLIFLVLITGTSSCVAMREMPYGRWENADLGMVLDVNPIFYPERDFPGFPGTYMKDAEEIAIFVFFSHIHGGFAMWREVDAPEWSGHNYDLALYRGTYRLSVGNQLWLRLDQASREQTGLDTIVFERIAEYEEPD